MTQDVAQINFSIWLTMAVSSAIYRGCIKNDWLGVRDGVWYASTALLTSWWMLRP